MWCEAILCCHGGISVFVGYSCVVCANRRLSVGGPQQCGPQFFYVCELLFDIEILPRLTQTVKVGIFYNLSEYDLLDSLCRTRKLKSRDAPALCCYLLIIAWFINSASCVLIPYTLSSMSGLDSGIASLLNCAYGSHIHGFVRQL